MAKKRAPRTRRRNSMLEDTMKELDEADAKKPPQVPSGKKKKKTSSKKKAGKPTGVKKKKKVRKTKQQLRVEEEWRSTNRGRNLDLLLSQVVTECRKIDGMEGLMVSRDASVLVGLPWPSFCLEWLTDNDVIPLSRMINIIGPPATCKSSLIFEFFRIFRAWGGGASYLENETKFADDLCRSVMRYPTEESVMVLPSQSMDHWQKGFNVILAKMTRLFEGTKTEPGPGRIVPVCFAVDSLMGKMSQELQDKVEAEGSVGRSFPVEAGALKNFLGTIPGKLADWPFLFLTSNHLKEKRNENTGLTEDHQPGGKSVRFQEAFEIKMGLGKNSNIDTLSKRGRNLIMTCVKNSHGQDKRKLPTRFLWWDEYDETQEKPKAVQISVWDWHWATIRLLANGPQKAWPETVKKRIKEVVDIRVVQTGSDGLAWSPTLGLKSKEKAVTFSELGAMLHEREDIKDDLRNMFGIKRRKVFQPGVDYREQREAVIEQVVGHHSE